MRRSSETCTQHPIVDKVLEYRGLKKLLSTYVEALPLLITRKRAGYTLRLTRLLPLPQVKLKYPIFRIYCQRREGKRIRKAFVPADGCIFFSADYSQIELRLMAHLSEIKA